MMSILTVDRNSLDLAGLRTQLTKVEEVGRSRIETWIATGRGLSPVGVYGTSMEVLVQIANGGNLIGADFDHYARTNQKYAELQQAGYNQLYFFFPFERGLKPQWVNAVMDSGFLPENASISELEARQIRNAESYAMVAAIGDSFKRHLRELLLDEQLVAKASDVDVLFLALSLNLLRVDTYQTVDWELPADRINRLRSWYSSQHMDDWFDQRGQTVISQTLRGIYPTKLVEIIKDSLSAPGVLIYFNNGMMNEDNEGVSLLFGVEMDTDMVVASRSALPSSVINGAVLVY